ncbi:MAG TPA: hypothetical protein VNB49_17605 [Candidatus Dormibacteraeota bacterium]|nr:hypothetical protein [Candidatus Dormibacteraeota bacterium]
MLYIVSFLLIPGAAWVAFQTPRDVRCDQKACWAEQAKRFCVGTEGVDLKYEESIV